jgi:phosphopantothenoylcysteine decarboxylase
MASKAPTAEIPSQSKPRIILAASGSVAAIKFGILADSLSDWAEVRAVATKSALHFIDRLSLPPSVKLYTDEDEWSSWSKIGDDVLHIELRKWADAMVVAPLSANTLAKVLFSPFLFILFRL